MPHAASDTILAVTSLAAENNVNQHITESVLTLQHTIRNIKQDVEQGIAPSILLPADPVCPLLKLAITYMLTQYGPKK
jgi:hypothetical protein